MNRSRAVVALSALTLIAFAGLAPAGPLNPPAGPITSTGKTTQEVFDKVATAEPRIAINATNTPGDATAVAVITQPGSYYLTADMVVPAGKGGIRVMADHVTIDLNSMTIRRAPGTTGLWGITDDGNGDDGYQQFSVRHGRIVGFGANAAAVYAGVTSLLVADDLNISMCENGLTVENGAAIATNIRASGTSNTLGIGIRGNDGTVVADSRLYTFGVGANVSYGVARTSTFAGCGTGVDVSRGRVEHCVFTTSNAGATGVQANAYAAVVSCFAYNMQVGVKIMNIQVSVEDNDLVGCGTGVQINANDASVRGNRFKGNTDAAANGCCIRSLGAATRAIIRDNEGSVFNFGINLAAGGSTVMGNRFGNPVSSGQAIYAFPIGTRHGTVAKSAGSANAIAVGSSSSATMPSTLGTTDPEANLYW